MTKITYDPKAIEEKWQQIWDESQLFQGSEDQEVLSPEDKMYILYAFAYPSGSGLHVGHVEPKTALDIMARYYRMRGKKVFFPVGWDAFGLPAENYAIKTGVPPAETTKDAIHTFRRQLKRIGISYDWQNEIATCHPEYYKWTQWIFLQLHKKGLAYQSFGSVNWCPSCQTVLANEQVVNGQCERCGSDVIQKQLKQWYFKITDYKDELISGLDQVDWPEATKQQQLNWIGKSEGTTIKFQLEINGKASDEYIEIFTTAHDTIFGCTFAVLAPEHTIISQHMNNINNAAEVETYIQETSKKTEEDRKIGEKNKTGIQIDGLKVINPLTNEAVPLFVADYVLATYGTGSIMAVPGHDERDYAFAKKYDLPIQYVTGENEFLSYQTIKKNKKEYILKNSGEFDGQDFEVGRKAILEKLISLEAGVIHTQYKLRDWLISRQRYWGAPIPIVYDPDGNAHPVKEEHLPWMLPTDVDFNPTGESPLTSSKEFKERVEKLYGKGWTPEYDTMDTFVDSSWYYLRYVDSRNSVAFADATQLQKWLPADFYMIGPEHIVLHLLYARFFTKFLRDEGYLSFDEPFTKMRHQGMILGPDGKKMSKSKGNVINPDDVVEKFGADTLRMYEMFMGPLEADKPWSVTAVAGAYRFLQRAWDLANNTQLLQKQLTQDAQVEPETAMALRRKLHQTIKKVTLDIPDLKFNTAIAALMEFVNLWEEESKKVANDQAKPVLICSELIMFIQLIAPFAPFMAEELYHLAGEEKTSVHQTIWPVWDEKLTLEDTVTIGVQVNGKLRAEITLPFDEKSNEDLAIQTALSNPDVQRWLGGKELRKTIYIPGKIVSLVV